MGGSFVSPALSGCASNRVSPHFQPRGSALDPGCAEGAGGERADREGPGRPGPWVFLRTGKQARTEPRGPKRAVRPSASSPYGQQHPRVLSGEGGWVLRGLCPSKSGPAEAQQPGERGRGARPPDSKPCPPPRRKPGRVCGERGGRAARPRSEEDPMEPRTAAGAGIDPAQLLPTIPLERLTRGPTRPGAPGPRAGSWGRPARQGRNPNVAEPQLWRRECPRDPTSRWCNLRASGAQPRRDPRLAGKSEHPAPQTQTSPRTPPERRSQSRAEECGPPGARRPGCEAPPVGGAGAGRARTSGSAWGTFSRPSY